MCETARSCLEVSAVAVTLMTDVHRGRLCAAGVLAATLDDVQFTTGDGPAVDAFTTGQPASAASLDEVARRWPALAPPMEEAGARAVFALPLRIGAASFGALTLYQEAAGPLAVGQRADAAAVAGILSLRVLFLQADSEDGELATALAEPVFGQAQIHQASGMVSVQLGVGIIEAFVVLRSHAFANDRPLADVAKDVLSRRIRFE
jgi:hypothetical protein